MEATTHPSAVFAAASPGPGSLTPAPEGEMHAIVQDRYGGPLDVLALRTVDKPAVGDGDVLVRVHAASVCKGDWYLVTGRPYLVRLMCGFGGPRHPIPGQDVAGTVAAVGRNVTRFQPGDEVFGEVGSGGYRGGFAEYVCVSEDEIVRKPARLSFEQAAAVPCSGLTALQGLRAGKLQSGQKVLINGASGGVGTFAVQIARSLGARVTGVCSTRNVEMVRSIGADQVIDYTREDFTRGGQRYDLMLDMVGNRALRDCRRVLTPKGAYVGVGGPDGDWIAPVVHMVKIMLASTVASQRMVPMGVMKVTQEDLVVLQGLLEAGEVTPVISRRYTLSDVADALRHQGGGHAAGKSVITVFGDGGAG